MPRKKRRIKSSYIYKLRREDNERFYGSGSSLPDKPSIFDSNSDFNQAIRKNKNA